MYAVSTFKKKASLTKLRKTQSKNVSVNTVSDDRKINYQAKKDKEKIFPNKSQALRVSIFSF